LNTDIHVSKLPPMRDAILEIAQEQLIRGGYSKLNFATIAKELETTRANLHYHFKNKETLAIEVMRQYAGYYINEFQRLRENYRGNFFALWPEIENMIWMQPDNNDDAKIDSCVTLVSDPDIPEAITLLSKESFNKIHSILTGIIQDAVDCGEIRNDIDVDREATRCHVLMMGINGCGQHLLTIGEAKKLLSGLIAEWADSLK